MPIYRLTDQLIFPPVEEAEDGILAVGGDLSPQRILLAYRSGIFPWYSMNQPIIWWSPDPRFVLFPESLIITRSMAQFMRNSDLRVTIDKAFDQVVAACAAQKRDGQPGTWITPEMAGAYTQLYESGYAHSVETWEGGRLVGGLYGISLGGVFFGESMFHRRSNASKMAFIFLVRELVKRKFHLIDCQVETHHLSSLGAELIPRSEFMERLHIALDEPTLIGKWSVWI